MEQDTLCNKEKIHPPLLSVGLEELSGENQEANPNKTPRARTSNTPENRREYARQWRAQNLERSRQYSRNDYRKRYAQYRAVRGTEEYKSRMRKYLRRHRAEYPKRHKASIKRWMENNPQWFKDYRQKYAKRRRELYQLRKEEICARKRELARTEKYNKRSREYLRRKRREDVQFALADALRATINRAFRRNWIKKPKRTEELLGCTVAEIKAHIQSQFTDGMSWSNRRSFVIDHHVPVVAFDLENGEEALWAFNWRNLRPLTRHDNAVKSDAMPNPLPSWLPAHIAARIMERSAQK